MMVPFGAAASPDLTILPVFLAATTAGVVTAVGSLVVFARRDDRHDRRADARRRSRRLRDPRRWLERWGNVFTAAVLVVIGLLVLLGIV